MIMDNREILEILTITMEECSEVIKECAKIQRFGLTKNQDMLELEIGDLMCMIEILEEYGLIDHEQVKMASKGKREKLKQWSTLNV
jgi:hypothetical protein